MLVPFRRRPSTIDREDTRDDLAYKGQRQEEDVLSHMSGPGIRDTVAEMDYSKLPQAYSRYVALCAAFSALGGLILSLIHI